MNLLLSTLAIAVVFWVTEACEGDPCGTICAGERKDPTNQRTFKSKKLLAKFNKHFDNENEKFVIKHRGRCVLPKVCPAIKAPICAIPVRGGCGKPKSLKNFCGLEKHNIEHADNEYEYYHDDGCNPLALAEADDCNCLVCEKQARKPVCAVPAKKCGRPVTFSNYCLLKKFNCEVPLYQLLYFHEGECYSDESDVGAYEKAGLEANKKDKADSSSSTESASAEKPAANSPPAKQPPASSPPAKQPATNSASREGQSSESASA